MSADDFDIFSDLPSVPVAVAQVSAPAPAPRPVVFVPNDLTEISESARTLFSVIAPKRELFTRGGVVVSLQSSEDGAVLLSPVAPELFRSLAERHATFKVRTFDGRRGEIIEAPRRLSGESARALLASMDARELLPRITAVTQFPPLRQDGSVQSEAYDSKSGILVARPIPSLPKMSPAEGMRLLRELLRDFRFTTPADESRALAAIIAPALRIGPWASSPNPFPIFLVEADHSQTGKGTLVKVIMAIYGETPALVSVQSGGVGSLDESLAQALMKGRPVILLDNLRGAINSQFVEALVTAGGPVQVRALRASAEVDSRRFVIFATSNGFEATTDFSNRLCVIRLKKQPKGYRFHRFDEGGLLDHLAANQSRYLGAVNAVLAEWIEAGEPTRPTEHDLRAWAGAMSAIIEGHRLPPLMDGHEAVQERVSNPGVTFLRELSIRIGNETRSFTTSELVDLAEEKGIPVPGVQGDDARANQKRLGLLLGKAFGDAETLEIDGASVERGERELPRPDGKGVWKAKTYRFQQVPQVQEGSDSL